MVPTAHTAPQQLDGETLPLICHPETPASSLFSIHACLARSALGQMCVEYWLLGDTETITLPEPVDDGNRRDELWRTTCFEAFVRRPGEKRYGEFNFAPSMAWAAYQFADYRLDMNDLSIDPPQLDFVRSKDRIHLMVATDLASAPFFTGNTPWQIGLSAVIEETNGTKSYWALAHPPGTPDFHHPDCFALTLPAFGGP